MYNEYHSLARHILELDLGTYLEFGCGDGGFLKYVLDLNDSFKSVTAVDINPESIQNARTTLEAFEVDFIVQEKLPLGLGEKQFTTITLSNTLHHLRDKPAVLAELKRLIKPTGLIIITEMISNDLTEAEQVYCDFHALRAETDRLNGIHHETTLSATEVLKLIDENELHIKKKEILLNDKIVDRDVNEISEMEAIIDVLVRGEIERPEFENLAIKALGIKERLKQFGIKRPRQIYLETDT
ncbi:MAG: class I SAM-dependent methyltransferase [Candidatus Marinimicrobia bacterium]|jgi:ubiquinone/menaquinone biosynthesis C-methylase UbiE|nr:class I SAM-dependent methyltransferase [Candidatus Neomarinimicrobiota bacterium]MBT4033557.1 class I SAM-dependent methyltransferase [Candidatus Neomarinimicrobiota bacterium]MBT4361601.1 class I SAM-dependent methyltransferase [Candidatus Neomarinimicrobiota bacterium]MBT4713638.1 class I SAM-dependent methyltransferase [Candidatus Neomarinimicrobiota bacterium]MBT4944550.1 class I SAM-dependent methyltransferase [Candidatus Neomarinimicrobiota bacterium]